MVLPLPLQLLYRRYWLTGNTCNPAPCDKSDPLYPNCDRKKMGYCGDFGADRPDKYPEEFWSCSDITIVKSQ